MAFFSALCYHAEPAKASGKSVANAFGFVALSNREQRRDDLLF